jgi:phytoene desaturase
MVDYKKRACVVGAGFGGLAVAIRLQAMGVQTVLFEARDKPGGRAYVYRDQGFTFDAGPTVITAPHCIEELFALAGRRMSDEVELLPVDPFYRLIWSDGDRFDYTGDEERLLDQIRRRSPRDVDGYKRFFEYSRVAFEAGYVERVATNGRLTTRWRALSRTSTSGKHSASIPC